MRMKRTVNSTIVNVLIMMLIPLVFAEMALAVGTPSGTTITNKASATFTDDNNNTYSPIESNVVSTTVSQVAGVSITPAAITQNAAQNGTVNYALALTNTGNGSDTFNVTGVITGGFTYTLYKDTNGDGILNGSEQDPLNVLAASVTLAADAVQYIIAVVQAPNVATGSGTLSLTTTSVLTPSVTQTATATTTIQAAVVTFTKTAAPVNPKPGDTVTYTISWINSGSADGYLIVLTDQIPTNTTFKTGDLMTYNGSSRTDASDGDNADYNITNAGKATVNIGTVVSGGTGNFTFQVTVDSGIASATGVSNTATVTYRTTAGDPSTETTVHSNSASFTIAQAASVQVLPPTLTTDELVGNQNLHPFTITNTSNGSDTYTISSVGLYWTWTVYNDVDQDQKFTMGIDTPVTDTNADTRIDTGIMASGATKYYIAVVTVTGSNGQQGRHTITATSLLDPTITGTSIKYTNIKTPVVALVKSVSPTGAQPPGTELTYTITVTNSGLAQANAFVLTDILSAYLAYVPGSMTVNAVIQTDADDIDFGRYDTLSGTVIFVIPTISGGASIPIKYKAAIK